MHVLKAIGCSLVFVFLLYPSAGGQVNYDSLPASQSPKNDTVIKRPHDPRKATIRSAILPGWGQAYNGKYWKIPIVYAAIGIPAYTFAYNKTWYDRTREAAKMLSASPPDTANFKTRVNEQLWVFFTNPGSIRSLLNYRNEFRRDMDYSVLITLLMWGLNVVDATVDGHLKEFDVGETISFRLHPTVIPGTNAAGIRIVFPLGNGRGLGMR